jgi:hypothetical protein
MRSENVPECWVVSWRKRSPGEKDKYHGNRSHSSGKLDRIFSWYSLTHSESWALLEKPPIVQLLKDFPAYYGTRRFITVLTRTLHWSPSWARLIQFSVDISGKIFCNSNIFSNMKEKRAWKKADGDYFLFYKIPCWDLLRFGCFQHKNSALSLNYIPSV